jgi:hypothetical protein
VLQSSKQHQVLKPSYLLELRDVQTPILKSYEVVSYDHALVTCCRNFVALSIKGNPSAMMYFHTGILLAKQSTNLKQISLNMAKLSFPIIA